MVSATAAESLLMGIFVLVCTFELRGVKAGVLPQHAQAAAAALPVAAAPGPSLSRSISEPPLATRVLSALPHVHGGGTGTPPRSRNLDAEEVGSIYGLDDNRAWASAAGFTQQAGLEAEGNEALQLGPLVLMMVLLHVIYPAFPISPQVELGRILTFLGFLWSVGPTRSIAVVNTEPKPRGRFLLLTALCVAVHACIFVVSDTISDLVFPSAGRTVGLFQGPRYLHQLFVYLAIRYPARSASFGPWAAWCVVSAVVFSSAVWKEFLFRGVYLGGLRTRMPFWAANATTGLIYALAHEPLSLSVDGTFSLQIVPCVPLLAGSVWFGYFYYHCNNLVITVLAHLVFNAGLLWLHLALG